MTALCWNCRGLGSPRSVRALHRLIQTKHPNLVFLMETKAKQQELESIKRQIGFGGMIGRDCVGEGKSRAGGLVLFWDSSWDVQLLSFSQNHIDVEIYGSDQNQHWRFTGIYGFPEESQKVHTWHLLSMLCSHSSPPWICAGDFNEIMWDVEKKGGLAKKFSAMQRFRDALDQCNLQDLGFSGYPFTWSNGRPNECNVQERLDRFCATEEWRLLFPFHKVEHVSRFGSDHHAIMLTFSVFKEDVPVRRSRLFRFEEAWCYEEGSEELLNQA